MASRIEALKEAMKLAEWLSQHWWIRGGGWDYHFIYVCVYIYRVVAWGSPEGNWSSLLSTLKNVFFSLCFTYIYMHTYYMHIYTQYMLLFDSLSVDPIEIESNLKFRCDKSWSPDLEVVMLAKLTSWQVDMGCFPDDGGVKIWPCKRHEIRILPSGKRT